MGESWTARVCRRQFVPVVTDDSLLYSLSECVADVDDLRMPLRVGRLLWIPLPDRRLVHPACVLRNDSCLVLEVGVLLLQAQLKHFLFANLGPGNRCEHWRLTRGGEHLIHINTGGIIRVWKSYSAICALSADSSWSLWLFI